MPTTTISDAVSPSPRSLESAWWISGGEQHGQRREHTWFSSPGSTRAGRGFRIDHAFASPSVARRVTGCRYDHAVRERGWSDHSLLLLAL
jgi:exonuclease III